MSTVTSALVIDVERAHAMVSQVPGEGGTITWAPLPDGGPEVARTRTAPDAGVEPVAVSWAVVSPGPVLLAGPAAWVESAAGSPPEAVEQALEGLGEVRLGEELPAFVVAAEEVNRLVSVRGVSFPLPRSLVMAASFEEETFLVAELFFEDERRAERFVVGVRRDIAAWGEHPMARLFQLTGLADSLELEQEGAKVTASARLGPADTRRALALTRLLLTPAEESPARPGTAVDGGGVQP